MEPTQRQAGFHSNATCIKAAAVKVSDHVGNPIKPVLYYQVLMHLEDLQQCTVCDP
jgi:hypothetical protein